MIQNGNHPSSVFLFAARVLARDDFVYFAVTEIPLGEE